MKRNEFHNFRHIMAAAAVLCISAAAALTAFGDQTITDTPAAVFLNGETSYANGEASFANGEAAKVLSSITVPASEQYVRPLGRTYYAANQLFLANSGSGCEFRFYGNSASITFTGDETTEEKTYDSESQARIAVYVNGERKVDTMIDAPEKAVRIINDAVPREYVIKVVKLSEAKESMTAIKSISVNAVDGIKATGQRPKLIEFVGDSLTCGFGLDDPDPTHRFVTGTEDVTKSYAYLAAEEVGADCNILAFSGYGVLFGNILNKDGKTVTPKKINQYYDEVSYSHGTIADTYIQDKEWSFVRPADIVVVNIGTNDYPHIQSGTDSVDDFRREYLDLLNDIWAHNPKAKILCTYGLMGKELSPVIRQIVQDYQNGPGGQSIEFLEFADAAEEDGLAAQNHPSAATHKRAAEQLSAKLREML